MGSLNIVDYFILICLIPAVIGGVMSGFVRQIAALAALVMGIWAGWHFSSIVAGGIRLWLGSDNFLIDIISFAIVFLAVLFGISMVGKAISKLLKIVMLGWLDRMLGVLFAVLKYNVIGSVIIFIIEKLDKIEPFLPTFTISQSKLYPIIASIVPKLFPYLEKINL